MDKSYQQVLDRMRLEQDTTLLKTFLLEFAWEPPPSGKREVEVLTDALTVPTTRASDKPHSPTIAETDEPGFYVVEWAWRNQSLVTYLDTSSDPERRFWIAYSLSDAAQLDVVMDRLASTCAAFDRVWLWPALLRRVQAQGEFRGIGLDYDYRRFELLEEGPNSDYFKLQRAARTHN